MIANCLYEVAADQLIPGVWRAECINDDGSVCVATFSGPEAEGRAKQYAAMMTYPLFSIVHHPEAMPADTREAIERVKAEMQRSGSQIQTVREGLTFKHVSEFEHSPDCGTIGVTLPAVPPGKYPWQIYQNQPPEKLDSKHVAMFKSLLRTIMSLHRTNAEVAHRIAKRLYEHWDACTENEQLHLFEAVGDKDMSMRHLPNGDKVFVVRTPITGTDGAGADGGAGGRLHLEFVHRPSNVDWAQAVPPTKPDYELREKKRAPVELQKLIEGYVDEINRKMIENTGLPVHLIVYGEHVGTVDPDNARSGSPIVVAWQGTETPLDAVKRAARARIMLSTSGVQSKQPFQP